MAPPTPTTTPMIIFLSDEEIPLLDELFLSPLSEAEAVFAAGVEVVVIRLATVLPLKVS